MTAQWRALAAPVAHIFTHFSLALTVHVAHVTENCQPPGEGEWWPLARIGDAGLPTLFRRAADAAMKESLQHARP
jgi:A/G-specific adenine glycosylase